MAAVLLAVSLMEWRELATAVKVVKVTIQSSSQKTVLLLSLRLLFFVVNLVTPGQV